MKELNDENGTSAITHQLAQILKNIVGNGLVGAEFGVAYGGGVEAIGKIWKGVGVIHGFDTFEGQPKNISYSPNSYEACCLDHYYAEFGSGETLTYEYQRKKLDEQGLDNVILHKGLINEHSLDGIDKLHYVLLDLDLINSMLLGWLLVRNKIVPGGFLCLHDVVPNGHMPGLWGLYQEILSSGQWEITIEAPQSYLAVLRRK